MNSEQLKAINTVTGPVITIAGPGSGKTSVIVGRLKHMTEDLGIAPESILVVTFSRAAADSMKSRFLKATNAYQTKINFGTFHSTFFNILKKYSNYTNENIITNSMSHRIILSLNTEKNELLNSNPDYVSEILSEIAFVKGQGIDIDSYESTNIPATLFKTIYKEYHKSMRELGKLDFEDMLVETYKLLKKEAHALADLQSYFKYILVDEFQDINPLQYSIIKMIAAPENNLFAVGDDDQSIYAFRGATPSVMMRMVKDYRNIEKIHLKVNYRSTEEILKAATNVIKNNKDRFPKDLVSFKPGGEKVVVRACASDDEEKKFIVESIEKAVARGVDLGEIAILLRTRADAASYASALLKAGLPFNNTGTHDSIYDNKHILPVLAYLRYAAGDHSRSNFLLIYNKPVRYIKRDLFTEETIDFDSLEKYYEDNGRPHLVNTVKNFKRDLDILSTLSPDAAIHYIRKVIGYDAYLKGDGGLRGSHYEEAIDKLNELEKEASGFKGYNAFFKYIEEYRDKLTDTKSEAHALNLMTYHGSKGLEFREVYMPNCIEGVTPHARNTSASELEEERRMFYVAMTRASERLTITHSLITQGREGRVCSRFVNEIELELKEVTKGNRVVHKVYKEGTVIHQKGDNLIVKFDKIAIPKTLNYKYCVSKNLLQFLD